MKVCVAVLDSGIYDKHKEFKGVPVYFEDFVNDREWAYDDNGHGTHVAGIVAGKNVGFLRDISILSVKILDKNGVGKPFDVRRACEYICRKKEEFNIRVANFSVGAIYDAKSNEILEECVRTMWQKGILVTCSAGNEGPVNGTVTSPGNSKWAVTVGAWDDYAFRDSKGLWHKNYSGRGPSEICVVKPDFLALGNKVLSADCYGGYTYKSGTSMAAPKISALAACMFKREPYKQPLDIKLALINLAKNMGLPFNRQGFGLIDDKTIKQYIKWR